MFNLQQQYQMNEDFIPTMDMPHPIEMELGRIYFDLISRLETDIQANEALIERADRVFHLASANPRLETELSPERERRIRSGILILNSL